MAGLTEKFVFNNSFEELYPLLNRMLAVVEQNFRAEQFEQLRGNCRLVFMEMFTNALKHSESARTDIDLLVNADHVKITKSDRGKVFCLPAVHYRDALQFPLEKDLTGKKITLYHDDMCRLSGTFRHANTMVIHAEHHDFDKPPSLPDLQEHYGLLIIAKVAAEFTYSYDPGEGMNVFSATISV